MGFDFGHTTHCPGTKVQCPGKKKEIASDVTINGSLTESAAKRTIHMCGIYYSYINVSE